MDLISAELKKTGSYQALDTRLRFGAMAEPVNENVAALANVSNHTTTVPPPTKKRKQPAKKKARKPKVTKKDLKEKIKQATDTEMIRLFEDILSRIQTQFPSSMSLHRPRWRNPRPMIQSSASVAFAARPTAPSFRALKMISRFVVVAIRACAKEAA